MNSLIFKATAAAVTVLAATAAAGSYVSTGFVLSPPFLWVAANAIIIWLRTSSRRRSTSSAGHADDVLNAAGDLYPSSDYEGFGAVIHSSGEAAPVVVSNPIRQQPREARAEAAARRTTDRARVPKKPAGEAAVTTTTEARETPRRPDVDDDDKKPVGDEMPRTVAAAEARRPEEDDDVSLDSLWQSMVQRRAVRPVSVRKSETWGNDELPRLQRAAETAAKRREMHKSVSSAAPQPPQESALRQLGWRTRDVLVRAQDDLMRRAESLIRRHYEQLRLQRQESEQRQAMDMEQQRFLPPAGHGAAPAGRRLIHAGFVH